MSERIKLREICDARSGDKIDLVNIGVLVRNPEDFDWVEENVTAESVDAHFAAMPHDKVERFSLPKIGALNFLMYGALGGGVSRSLIWDGHGKGFCMSLLEMEIDSPPRLRANVGEQ